MNRAQFPEPDRQAEGLAGPRRAPFSLCLLFSPTFSSLTPPDPPRQIQESEGLPSPRELKHETHDFNSLGEGTPAHLPLGALPATCPAQARGDPEPPPMPNGPPSVWPQSCLGPSLYRTGRELPPLAWGSLACFRSALSPMGSRKHFLKGLSQIRLLGLGGKRSHPPRSVSS